LLGENTPHLNKKFIAWAKVVQRAGSFFALAKILSLGQKISHLGENTPNSTLAPGAFSPGGLYPRLSETTFSPRQKQSREHTCYSKPFSPGRIMQKNISYQIIYAVFTTTELVHMSQITNLTRNSTCIPSISTYSSCIPEWINYLKLNLNFMPPYKPSQMHFHMHILNETLTHKQIWDQVKWKSASLTWIALEVLSNSPKA